MFRVSCLVFRVRTLNSKLSGSGSANLNLHRLYFLIIALALIPDSFRSFFFQFPVDEAEGSRTEQVSSLSDIDQVIQLIFFCSAHFIHLFHSSLSRKPLPLASLPADSDIKRGSPVLNAFSARCRQSFL